MYELQHRGKMEVILTRSAFHEHLAKDFSNTSTCSPPGYYPFRGLPLGTPYQLQAIGIQGRKDFDTYRSRTLAHTTFHTIPFA